jgi:hypothetical protein
MRQQVIKRIASPPFYPMEVLMVRVIMEVRMASDFDAGNTKVLWEHRCCNKINNFGKLEYLKVEDACSCLELLKSKFCRCTDKVECFYCYNIKRYCGERLLDYNIDKFDATQNTGEAK